MKEKLILCYFTLKFNLLPLANIYALQWYILGGDIEISFNQWYNINIKMVSYSLEMYAVNKTIRDVHTQTKFGLTL